MDEIYQRHASEYNELVRAEDVAGNLPALLWALADWNGRCVYEAGIGTGRVTTLYVEACLAAFATDRSDHMLAYAAQKLSPWANKLILQSGENLALPVAPWPADIFIEGWSFGHTLLDGKDDAVTTPALVAQAERCVKSGGTIILIETLGTAVAEPQPPDPRLAAFYKRLEAEHGFKREVIRTDYRFATLEEAVRVMGFFFGPDLASVVAAEKTAQIKEWTGVWWKKRND